ncbi:hypothetical protein ACM26V_19145 [Salipaludibacillus sp. HK11]|uniref:hypothetical protein n=1 Tax=Salipaludibacillus sp. HK11 TaxID=3394320 RepID=UPI0039FDD397
MNEQKIYVLLTDTGTLLTRMIKLYTKDPYNHASISFDPHLVNVYSFGRKTVSNPFIGGFVKENMRDNIFKQARCAIYSCNVTSDQLQKMRYYIEQIEAEKHLYRYNFLGLFAVTFNKRMVRKNAFFCSEFVATVLQDCNVTGYKKVSSLVTPNDLIENASFQLEYEGNLEDFYKQMELQPSVELAYMRI